MLELAPASLSCRLRLSINLQDALGNKGNCADASKDGIGSGMKVYGATLGNDTTLRDAARVLLAGLLCPGARSGEGGISAVAAGLGLRHPPRSPSATLVNSQRRACVLKEHGHEAVLRRCLAVAVGECQLAGFVRRVPRLRRRGNVACARVGDGAKGIRGRDRRSGNEKQCGALKRNTSERNLTKSA